MKPSPVIYHGPSAETQSQVEIQSKGVLAVPPFGTSKDDAREFVVSAMTSYPGDRVFILLGPLDDILPGTTDVLLKTLEENPPLGPELVLWCRDLGSVSKTIRSRCLDCWCPGKEASDPQTLKDAENILSNAHQEKWHKVVESVSSHKENLRQLLIAIISVVATQESSRKKFWTSLRRISGMKTLTVPMVVGALTSP